MNNQLDPVFNNILHAQKNEPMARPRAMSGINYMDLKLVATLVDARGNRVANYSMGAPLPAHDHTIKQGVKALVPSNLLKIDKIKPISRIKALVGKKEIIFILSSNWLFEFGRLKTSYTFPLSEPNLFNIKKINFLFKNIKGKIKKK